MKMISYITTYFKGHASKILLSLSMTLITSLSYATGTSNEDIMKQILAGSMGKTIGKDGMIWTVLMGFSFLVGSFWAVRKHDPMAFIPAFFIVGIISTIVGIFITY